MNRYRLVAIAAAALVTAGCSVGGSEGPTSSSPTPTPTTSAASPTPSSTPTDSPGAQAEAAVVAFWKLRDELASDPSQGVTRLSDVARGQALDVHRRSLNAQAANGWKQVGSTEVTPQSAKPSDKPDEYVVTACVNVAKVNIVDAEGKSQVPPGRPDQSAYDYTVQQDGAKWYVIKDLLEAKPCASS